MLEKNQRFKSLLYVLADAALLSSAFCLPTISVSITSATLSRAAQGLRWPWPGTRATSLPGWPRRWCSCSSTGSPGIYSTTRLRGLAERCTKIAVINAAGLLIFIGALYLMHLDDYSRIVLALFYILGTAGVVIERMILRWGRPRRRRKGLGLRHILLVGGGKSAALYLRALEHNPYYGFVVDGYLAGIEEPGLGVRYMGSYDALSARLDEVAVDEVVVALEADEIELLPHVLPPATRRAHHDGTVLQRLSAARPTIDVLDECKLINVRQTPFDNLLNAAVKRGLDIIGSLILIILTSPVMLVTAIGVKLSSPGPVIFRQERIGLNKKPFMMYKFRSMRVNVQQETGWSTDCDPRKTHFGSFIRKFSLDELPQFFNVLKGDMSLVGPRPRCPTMWSILKRRSRATLCASRSAPAARAGRRSTACAATPTLPSASATTSGTSKTGPWRWTSRSSSAPCSAARWSTTKNYNNAVCVTGRECL